MAATENIVVTISGAGITPERLSASDLADVIVAIEKSIAAIVKAQNPALAEEEITLGLTRISRSSAILELVPTKHNNQLPAFDTWTESIVKDAFEGLPVEAVEGAKTLVRVSGKIRGIIDLSARTNGKTSEARITPDTVVTAPEPVYVRGETVVYGKVIDVGGNRAEGSNKSTCW